jgi:DNA-binding GntR family transcriptional regulator
MSTVSSERIELSKDSLRTTLADKVIATVQDGVRNGRFAPGQRVHEHQLMKQLDVGRGSVREALRLLAADGVVEIVPHRGAIIRQFSRAEVCALYEIRGVLEGLAAALAAERIASQVQRDRIYLAMTDVETAILSGDPELYIENNAKLHATIVSLSDNPCLPAMIERSHISSLRLQTGRFLNRKMMEARHDEHREVVQAILAGNIAAADTKMRAHIHGSRALLLALPEFVFRTI